MLVSKYKDDIINIAEYCEAEALIKSLAEVYAEDYSIIARGGRGRNKTAYYHYPCSFDIETTTIKPGMFNYIGRDDDPPIAFPYLFQFNIYGFVIFCRHYHECMNVFRWISEAFGLGEYKKMIFFDHNLGYEYSFFMDLWNIEAKESFALDEHHPVTIKLTNGIIFRDSYKMTNMSLATLTKDWSKKWFKETEIMDYSKIRTPYDELEPETILYSALDVLSLSDAIIPFLRARGEEIWTRCPTSTSFIRKELKEKVGAASSVKKRNAEQKKYIRLLEGMKLTEEQYKLIKELARGGNTHANRAYTGKKLEGLGHFDITSSYPAQMVCYPEFPVGPFVDIEFNSADELFACEDNGYCTINRIALINPRLRRDINVTVPYIATAICSNIKGWPKYSDNGRYVEGSEGIVLSIFGNELPIIINQYDFDDIVFLESYAAPKGYLPDLVRDFVLELYAKKTEYKGIEGKEVEYALSKTYVNGVYGMCYTDPVRQNYEFTDYGIYPKEAQDIGEALNKHQNSKSYFLPYVWGAMVACLGRLYLQKMIDACGDDFVYADTDSVFCLNYEKSKKKIKELEHDLTALQRKCGKQLTYFDKKGRPQELGSISEEPFVEQFKTYGAKKYVTIENGELQCTIAGVPKKKGAEIIGSIDNFNLGLCFRGEESGKMAIWYNPKPPFNLSDNEGRPIEIYSNAAMLPCSYLLGISVDYRECLYIEGSANNWMFTELSEG